MGWGLTVKALKTAIDGGDDGGESGARWVWGC